MGTQIRSSLQPRLFQYHFASPKLCRPDAFCHFMQLSISALSKFQLHSVGLAFGGSACARQYSASAGTVSPSRLVIKPDHWTSMDNSSAFSIRPTSTTRSQYTLQQVRTAK